MRKQTILLLSVLVVLTCAAPACQDEKVPVFDQTNPSYSTSPQQLGNWFEELTAIVQLQGTSGPEASRVFAYASIAFYEGFALSDKTMRTLEGQLAGLEDLPRVVEGQEYNFGIIAESAMTEVLQHGFNGSLAQNVIRSTYQNHENRYADLGVVKPIIDRSRDHGKLLGQLIIEWMDADGFDAALNCDDTLSSAPNTWQPTPPDALAAQLPCWGQLRPFTFAGQQLGQICASFFPVPVSNVPTSAYMVQVQDLLQTSQNLTQQQRDVALYWRDAEGSYSAPGHYMALFRDLIAQKQLSGKQTAIMFAQLCIAMADVHIIMYRDKYAYARPRPITFIRANGYPNWTSFNLNPPTPEFPSVQAGLGYAAGQVFTNIYGNQPFTDNSMARFGFAARSYSDFNAMADEVALAQVYGGTNYRATALAAEYTARCIAQRSNELFLNQ